MSKITNTYPALAPLFDMHVTLDEPLMVGLCYVGYRMIYGVKSGYFASGGSVLHYR